MLDYQIHTSGPAQKAPQRSSIEEALKEFLRTEDAVTKLMATQQHADKVCAPPPADVGYSPPADHTMSMSLSLPTLTSPHPLGPTSLAAIGGGCVKLGDRANITVEEALGVIAERVGCLSTVGVSSTSLPANALLGGALEWSLAEDHLLIHLGAQHEDLLRGYLRARESMPEVFPKPFDVWKEAAQIVQPDTTQSRRSISIQRQSLAGGTAPESVFPECLLSDRYRILTTTKVRKELLAKMPYILAPLIDKGASMRSSAMAASFNSERPKSRSVVDNADLNEARCIIRGPTKAVNESMTVQLFNSDIRETPAMGAQFTADGSELKKCCGLIKALSDGGHGLTVPIDTADPSWNTLLAADAAPGQDIDAKRSVLDPATIGSFIQLAQCPQAIQRFMDKDAEYNTKTARTLDELLNFQRDLEGQRQFAEEATSTVKVAHITAIKGRFETMMERDIASIRGAYSAHIAREVRVVEEAWDGHRSRMEALFEFDKEYLSRSVAAFLPSNLRAHHSTHEALIQVMSDDFGLTVGDLLCGADPFDPTCKMSLSVAARQTTVEPPSVMGTLSGEHFIEGSGIAKMLVLSQALVAPALHESVVKYAASVCSEGSQLRVALAPGAAAGSGPSLRAAIIAQQRRYEFLASLMCLPYALCRVQELLLPQLGDRDVIAVHNAISCRVPTSESKQTESRFKLLRTDRHPKSWEAQALTVAAEEVGRRAAAHIQLARTLTADVRAAIQQEVQEWRDTNTRRAKEVLGDENIDLCYVPPIIPLEGVSKAATPFVAWGGTPTTATDGAASSDTTTQNLVAVAGMAGVSLAAIKCNPQDVPYLLHNPRGSARRPAADSTVVSAPEDTWGTYTSAMLHTPNEPVRLVSSYACTIGHSAAPTVFEVTIPAVEAPPSGTRGIPSTMAVGLVLANNGAPANWGAGGVLWYSSGLLVIDGTRCSTGASYHHGDTLGVELGMLDGQVSLYRNGKKVLPVPGGIVSPIPLDDNTDAPPSSNLHVIRPPLLRLVPGRTYSAAVEMFVPAAESTAPTSPASGGGLLGGSLRGRDIGLSAAPMCSPALEGCITKALPIAASASHFVPSQERTSGLQLPPALAEAVVNLDGPFTHFPPSGVCSFQIGCFM